MTFVAANHGPQYPYPMPQAAAYPGYAYGPAPAAYGADAYQSGYQAGAQWVSPYAAQTQSAGNGLNGIASSVSGLVNGIVGGVGDLLGGLVNAFSGLTGGGAASAYPQAQQGYYAQQAYGQAPAQVYLQHVPPPPPGANPWGTYSAVINDFQRYGIHTPQRGLEKIAMDSRAAKEYREQADNLLRRAGQDIREAVRLAESAARTGDPGKMADARARQQEAFNSWRQAGELVQAVYNCMASAHISYNLLFGPYGRMPGADGNQSHRFLDLSRIQYLGGREPGWFKPTVMPPAQRHLQMEQEIIQASERILQLGGGR